MPTRGEIWWDQSVTLNTRNEWYGMPKEKSSVDAKPNSAGEAEDRGNF